MYNKLYLKLYQCDRTGLRGCKQAYFFHIKTFKHTFPAHKKIPSEVAWCNKTMFKTMFFLVSRG
jgi:hypothetical protein